MGWGQGISLQGAPGSKIIFGHGAPSASDGVTNDVYFDQDTSYIYQKASTGWPTQGTLLQGKMGFGGADGFSFDVGPQNPTATDGKPKDFFVNYATGEVFGPKGTDNSWPDTGFSLKGIPGAPGENGVRGATITFGDRVPSVTPPANPILGDVYIVKSTGDLFVYDGTSFGNAIFSIIGQPGNPGQDGLRGTQTFYGQGAPTQQTITDNNAMPGDNYYDITPGAVAFYVLQPDNQ